jgi:hypothetical protein
VWFPASDSPIFLLWELADTTPHGLPRERITELLAGRRWPELNESLLARSGTRILQLVRSGPLDADCPRGSSVRYGLAIQQMLEALREDLRPTSSR